LDKSDILMTNYYVNQIQLITVTAQIGYGDYSCYIPMAYGDWYNNSLIIKVCAPEYIDAPFRVTFPRDWVLDKGTVIPVANEFWFTNSNCYIKILSNEYFRDISTVIGIADYVDATCALTVIGNQMKSADYRMRSDYDVAEVNYYFIGGDEFCYTDGLSRICIDIDFDADYCETNTIVACYYEAGKEANYRFRLTGNLRYINRIRFKERDRYGSLYYKLEYMIPNEQVWELLSVTGARVNDIDVPPWSPILNNPCYANIYRSNEWIDIYVDPVWCTEVRITTYSTEDPFNRTGVIELGVFQDIEENYLGAFKIGWYNDWIDSTGESWMFADFMVKWWTDPDMYNASGVESIYVNSIKVDWISVPYIAEDFCANCCKIYFDPLYIDCKANYIMRHDIPWKDYSFYLDTYYRGEVGADCYIPIIYDDIIDANTLLYTSECVDATTSIKIVSNDAYADATCGVYSELPWIDATTFIPIPDFSDHQMYFNAVFGDDTTSTYRIDVVGNEIIGAPYYVDTMPSAEAAGNFNIPIAEPYKDANFHINSLAIDFMDSTSEVYICMRVLSEDIAGSYNIGWSVDINVAGSYNVGGGTVSAHTVGSYNVYGSIFDYNAFVYILNDDEAKKLTIIGYDISLEDEIPPDKNCGG
jgi:hypothetical protein